MKKWQERTKKGTRKPWRNTMESQARKSEWKNETFDGQQDSFRVQTLTPDILNT